MVVQLNPADCIIDDFLWLGGAAGAADETLMRELGITHIVNATIGEENAFEDSIAYLRCAVDDFPRERIGEHFEASNRFIATAKESGGRVLVHCLQGRSRSATLVLAYLMRSEKMSVAEAFRLVRRKRRIQPNVGFMYQLREFEKLHLPQECWSIRFPKGCTFESLKLLSKYQLQDDQGNWTTYNAALIRSRHCSDEEFE